MNNSLENFPISKTALQMMERVSPIYDRSYVGKWLFQVMGMEMDEARKYFDELRLQAFPETATWGLVYWEERYGIQTDPTLDIEKRRHNVLKRRGNRPPMNPARIEKIVTDVCGCKTSVIENVSPYTFRVDIFSGDNIIDFREIKSVLKKIKPSHLSVLLNNVLQLIKLTNNNNYLLNQLHLNMQLSNNMMQCNNVKTVISLSVENQFSLKASVFINSMYILDGSSILDGSRKLNAKNEREDI